MPQEPSTNTYETINYNMFQYGFTNPEGGSSGASLTTVEVASTVSFNTPPEFWGFRYFVNFSTGSYSYPFTIDTSLTPPEGARFSVYMLGEASQSEVKIQGFNLTNHKLLGGGTEVDIPNINVANGPPEYNPHFVTLEYDLTLGWIPVAGRRYGFDL